VTAAIVQFLEARFAEQETKAHDLGGERWATGTQVGNGYNVAVVTSPWGTIVSCGIEDLDDGELRAAHVAANDPEYVLADITSKRAILIGIASWRHRVVDDDCWYTCWAATEDRDGGESCEDDRTEGKCTCGLDFRRMAVYRNLAAPFHSHPDFDPAWKVTDA
jgi:hypothetical protein